MLDIELGKRIKVARLGVKLSQLEISKKLQITDKTYRNYEKGNNITVNNLREIAEITKTNFYFLLNGEENYSNLLNKENIDINFYPEVYAAAGYGAINGDVAPKTIQLSKTFLDEILEVRNYSRLDIIRVYGDSMEPYISNGEYVIIEKNHEAYNGETVIANINGEVYIKKFQKDPFGQWIKLISDNKSYDDILIKGENLNLLQIVGIVRAKIKPF